MCGLIRSARLIKSTIHPVRSRVQQFHFAIFSCVDHLKQRIGRKLGRPLHAVWPLIYNALFTCTTPEERAVVRLMSTARSAHAYSHVIVRTVHSLLQSPPKSRPEASTSRWDPACLLPPCKPTDSLQPFSCMSLHMCLADRTPASA